MQNFNVVLKMILKIGYDIETNKPCDVCGKEGENQMEPRFGYVVCEKHYKMTPLQVTEAKERRLKSLSCRKGTEQ